MRPAGAGKYIALLALLSLMAVSTAAQSSSGPETCDGPDGLAIPGPDLEPAIRILHLDELTRTHWKPPACSNWSPDTPTRLVIEMVGSFRFDGTLNDLLARAGAVSNLRHVKYWSTTESKLRPLVTEASALKSPARADRRADFSAAELTQGAPLYYWVDDSRLGDIVYEVNAKISGAHRAIIMTENVSAIDPYFVPLFEPKELQSMDILSEVSPGLWRLYSLGRIGKGSRLLAVASDQSFINRAKALFRFLSGAATDRERPTARD